MIGVVIISHKCNINPGLCLSTLMLSHYLYLINNLFDSSIIDNVATPIAASLGDLTTLALLAQFSNILFYTVGKCTE